MRKAVLILAAAVAVASTLAGCRGDDTAATGSVASSSAPVVDHHSLPPAPTATTEPACKPKVDKVTSPHMSGQTIIVPEGRKGFTIQVTFSCVGPTDRIWFFDQSAAVPTDDKNLYMDQGFSDMPSPVAVGPHVKYTDSPAGDDLPDLANEPYKLVMVVDNNTACNTALRAVREDGDGNYKLPSLPKGCLKVGEQHFTVVKY